MPDVVKGKKAQKSFIIRNTGDQELVIKEARACCGYNVINLSSWSVQPGAISEIILELDSANKIPGKYQKEITITSNDASAPTIKIPVYSNIIAESEQPVIPNEKPVVLVSTGAIQGASAEDLSSRVSKSENINLIDVREAPEFSEKHIQGALNFPKSKFKSSQDDVEASFSSIDKKNMTVVYCGSGFRSNYIAKKLRQYGWDAYNLEGGLTVWEKNGYFLINGAKIPPESEPLKINLEEAYDNYFILFKDSVVWIDVRTRDEFENGRISGAINIPLALLSHYYDFIPKDKEIVLYCQGLTCDESTGAGRQLIANGFKQGKIKVFQDGFDGWMSMNYPVENTRRAL